MFALVLILILSTTVRVSARTWEVHADGTGDAPTIQAAIDSLQSDDDIVLADGVYSGPGNRDLYNAEKLFTIASQSGNPTACVIDCQGAPDDPHWGFALDVGG